MENLERSGPAGPIESLLFKGKENARPSRELMGLLGYGNIRRFRKQVARERRAGALILGCPSGLFLPDDGEKGQGELKNHIKTSEKRIKGIGAGLKPARHELLYGGQADQLTLDLEGGVGGKE